ncbi:MAG: DUF1467 family protein [Rhodospirillales bacterium]|jgi:predicted secreted protein|nr:DUF1467 family protein [Rhodospirillales bacterium]
MGWVTALAIYFIIWWITLFMILPFGVRPHSDKDEGQEPGAPERPRLLIKMAVNSVVAFIVWLAVFLIDRYDLITLESL